MALLASCPGWINSSSCPQEGEWERGCDTSIAVLCACAAEIYPLLLHDHGSWTNSQAFDHDLDLDQDFWLSASKNTDLSVFYTEIETKILNTDSDPKNTDRDPITRVIAIQQITVTLRWKSEKSIANL